MKPPKPSRVIYRNVAALTDTTLRRYVVETDEENIVVELPDSMPVADAQYLAAQALADSYTWRKMAELTITTLRTVSAERDEFADGIEELLAQLESEWAKKA